MRQADIIRNKPMFRRWDIVIAIIIIVIAVLAVFFAFKSKGETVIINLDGKVIYSLPLNQDKVIELEAGTVIIENNTVRIVNPSCPDKLCERQGRISKAGESIICLPNRLIITITGEREWDIII